MARAVLPPRRRRVAVELQGHGHTGPAGRVHHDVFSASGPATVVDGSLPVS